MKKLFSFLLALCIASSAFAGKNVTLRDVMYGGYWPQTYNLTKQLSANAADNVFTFVYTPMWLYNQGEEEQEEGRKTHRLSTLRFRAVNVEFGGVARMAQNPKSAKQHNHFRNRKSQK